jgi:ketosteroid isomerase-like protein
MPPIGQGSIPREAGATKAPQRSRERAALIEEEHWPCVRDTESMPGSHVRMRVKPPPVRRHRTVDQRLFLRMPKLVPAFTRGLRSLPLRSRLRSAVTKRFVRERFAAYNRRDWDVLLVGYHPEVENDVHHVAGIEGVRHGHAGWRHYWQGWFEAWDESYGEPFEVVDFADDRLLVLWGVRCRAEKTGIELEEQVATLLTFRAGLIARHEEWFDHAAGLRATGLDAYAGSTSRGRISSPTP